MSLLHIATVAEWEEARARGRYEPGSLAAEGFVHCSLPGQLPGVIERFFQGRDDLVVLEIDEDRLGAELRFENTEGGDELFPHVYGPIELEAVTDAHPLAPDDGGDQSGG